MYLEREEVSFALYCLLSFLCLLCSILAAVGGTGGGSLFIPIFSLAFPDDVHRAVPLSKTAVFGVALGACFMNLTGLGSEKHQSSFIHFRLATLIQPATLVGCLIGVFLNLLLPSIYITCILVFVLAFTAYKTWTKTQERRHVYALSQLRKSITVSAGEAARGSAFLSTSVNHEHLSETSECFVRDPIDSVERSHAKDSVSSDGAYLHLTQSFVDDTNHQFGDSAYSRWRPSDSPKSSAPTTGQSQRKQGPHVSFSPGGQFKQFKGSSGPPSDGGGSPSHWLEYELMTTPTAAKSRGRLDDSADRTPTFRSAISSTHGNSLLMTRTMAHLDSKESVVPEAEPPHYNPLWEVVFLALNWTVNCFTLFLVGGPAALVCGPLVTRAALYGLVIFHILFMIWTGSRLITFVRNLPADENPVSWDWVQPLKMAKYCLLSCCAGIAAGMVGIGGGLIKGPLLIHIGLSPISAVATSNYMILFTSTTNVVSYFLADRLDWRHSWVFTGITLAGGIVGVTFLRRHFAKESTQHILAYILIASIILGCVAMTIASAREQWLHMQQGNFHEETLQDACAFLEREPNPWHRFKALELG